jgi:hypothetical protein
MMLGEGEDPNENDPDNGQLIQNGSYTPCMFFYGIPPGTADNDDNHAFVQFWHYETASFEPYDGPVEEGGGQDFIHDGDWEMVQLCIQLGDADHPWSKPKWHQPWAATASQHYYGQTLAWRRDADGAGSSAEDQRYVEHAEGDSTGNRFKIFIAQGAHATYFRKGEIDFYWDASPGTQVQYDNDPNYGRDAIEEPLVELADGNVYQLLPLLSKDGAGIFDWGGRWGSYHKFTDPPPGPSNRQADGISISTEPVNFHNSCRKHVDSSGDFAKYGDDDPLTELFQID